MNKTNTIIERHFTGCETPNDHFKGISCASAQPREHSNAQRKITWKRVLDRRLPDLNVLYRGQTVLGFIYKLADTSTGKSQFCCNTGCGDTAKLVGHRWTYDQAKLATEEAVQYGL